jgi:hypothetical protein
MRTSAPFQVGANSEPLCHPLQATLRFLRALNAASPTVFLTVHLPPFQQTGAVARNRGSRVPIPTDPSIFGPIRLAPAYPPMALRRRASITKGCNRPFTILVRAYQQLWLFEANGVCNSSLMLCMRNLPGPHTARRLAVSIPSWSPGWTACKEGTLSPELRTRLLPVTHVQVGNCWSYSKSQLQSPMFRLLSVTRQRRALPSTALPIYVRRTATRVALVNASKALNGFPPAWVAGGCRRLQMVAMRGLIAAGSR